MLSITFPSYSGSAPQAAVPLGTEVLIQGTVTDQSPASKDTPAVSDESMSAWMEYLHMQKVKPDNATGVSVHLTAIDPNGNFQDIGTVSTNILGNYACSWTPPVPGLYTVTASFEGTNSYYTSQAGTALVVSKAAAANPSVAPIQPATGTATSTPTLPAPTSTPTQSTASSSPSEAPPPPTSAMPTTTYIAIGAAVIIIIAAGAVLVLRRRK